MTALRADVVGLYLINNNQIEEIEKIDQADEVKYADEAEYMSMYRL